MLTYGSWEVLFSLQPWLPKKAQNLISVLCTNYFIKPSCVGSLLTTYSVDQPDWPNYFWIFEKKLSLGIRSPWVFWTLVSNVCYKNVLSKVLFFPTFESRLEGFNLKQNSDDLWKKNMYCINTIIFSPLYVVTLNLCGHVYSAIYVWISKKVGRRYGSGIGIGK